MNTFLFLALILFVAYLMRQLLMPIKLPAVTGYVLAGVLLGGSLFKLVPGVKALIDPILLSEHVLQHLSILADVALGIISFSIGLELNWVVIKKLGKTITFIVLFEAIGTFVIVMIVFALLFPEHLLLGLLLAAIASATAPAATVSVINEYRAAGPLTTTILAVVGIDDAISLVIFVFASAVLKSALGHEGLHVFHMLSKIGLELVLALVAGLIPGYIITYFFKKARYLEDVLFLVATGIFVTVGAAELFDTSPILANMCFGAVVINLYPKIKTRISQTLNGIAPIFFAIFFILGGAHLDISLLPRIGLMGLMYFLSRSAGKIGCAMLGARLSSAPPVICRYIGLSLIPQVGVAVALALTVQNEFGTGAYGAEGVYLASTTVNILLFTTILTEILGPYLTKTGLIKAGEARLQQ